MGKRWKHGYFNTSHVSINLAVLLLLFLFPLHFNTSHVSINHNRRTDWIERKSISIHLMFLLIGLHRVMQKRQHNFNTSHASINQASETASCLFYCHFNTSHVSINLCDFVCARLAGHYFNTSHVSINLFPAGDSAPCSPISIHLMFLLILSRRGQRPLQPDFNTSHVSINPICAAAELLYLLFQYISCFY